MAFLFRWPGGLGLRAGLSALTLALVGPTVWTRLHLDQDHHMPELVERRGIGHRRSLEIHREVQDDVDAEDDAP